jgi:6-phosphogluconolactonase (cycloisomerase 2 family)
MNSKLKLAVCLSAMLFPVASFAQAASTSAPSVAYVYIVSRPANASATEIDAYTASPNGKLTPLSGSPFQDNEAYLTTNGKYLFGTNSATPNIDSFAIGADGAPSYVTSTDYAQFDPDDCGSAGSAFTDRTGAYLYPLVFNGDCSNNYYQSYRINEGSGELNYLGSVNGGAGSFMGIYLPATFIGNDEYAYSATNNGCMYYGVQGFRRDANGLLAAADVTVTRPAPPDGYSIYIPEFVSADPLNHVAFVLQAANPPGCQNNYAQLASFTADSEGNLTTTNNSANMPATLIQYVNDLKMSPSGKLLAVAGTNGVQVFHFNGANPPTAYTPLLTTDNINQMFWDNDNHLYGINQAGGNMHVFTVTPAAYSEAPGSPYTISQPQSIAVLPETPLMP